MKVLILIVAIATSSGIFFTPALAGMFESGGSLGYQRSNYGGGSFTWTRRYSATFGYYFTQDSQVEFMYQDSTTRTFVKDVQDVQFRDRVYSINLVHQFFRNERISPFIRAGIGQLNRDASGTYQGGFSPPPRVDSVTGILGAGIKIRVTQGFSLKVDATTFLAGGAIGTWNDNFAVSFGASVFY
jgi:hypothetical protein